MEDKLKTMDSEQMRALREKFRTKAKHMTGSQKQFYDGCVYSLDVALGARRD